MLTTWASVLKYADFTCTYHQDTIYQKRGGSNISMKNDNHSAIGKPHAVILYQLAGLGIRLRGLQIT